jgi:hypothetical protein
MGNKRVTITDPDLAKVGVALRRAAAKARQLGFDTNTPVYVFRNGKIVDIVAEHRTAQSPKRPTAKSSQKKTTSHPEKAQSKKIR